MGQGISKLCNQSEDSQVKTNRYDRFGKTIDSLLASSGASLNKSSSSEPDASVLAKAFEKTAKRGSQSAQKASLKFGERVFGLAHHFSSKDTYQLKDGLNMVCRKS